jgi:hypothetical protein
VIVSAFPTAREFRPESRLRTFSAAVDFSVEKVVMEVPHTVLGVTTKRKVL